MTKVRLDAKQMDYMVSRYSGKPISFCKEILNMDFDSWQLRALTNLEGDKTRRMSRTAAHGVGKSVLAGMVALYRLCTMPESQTFLTSATYAQLTTRLYPTVIRLINKSIINNWFDYNSEKIKIKGLNKSWIIAQPWSKSNPESLAGLHVYSPALIADEASAIDDIIFESWEGSMQHENSFLMLLGNPLYRTGELFASANSKRNLYDYESISGLDSRFTSKEWIKEVEETYGADSDVFRVRCLGQFPAVEQSGFNSEAEIRKAINRNVQTFNESIVGGLDVARYGNDASVLFLRKGYKTILLKRWHKLDTMDMAEEVSRIINEYNVSCVAVDGHGVGGPVFDRLRKLQPNKIIEINLSADGGKEYNNKRTQLWGLAREWIKHASIPNDEDLVRAGSSLLYTFDNKGRTHLESKDLAKRRGVHSPDAWDALSYSLAVTPSNSDGTTIRKVNNTINLNIF